MPDEACHMWYQHLIDNEILKVRGVAMESYLLGRCDLGCHCVIVFPWG